MESVWDYPRPPALEPERRRVRVVFAGETIADSVAALRVLETSHPPTIYLPPGDVALERFRPGVRTSVCEWKGMARYLDLAVDGRREPAVAWTYRQPVERFAALRDHVALYPAGWTPATWTRSVCSRRRETSTAGGSRRSCAGRSRAGGGRGGGEESPHSDPPGG